MTDNLKQQQQQPPQRTWYYGFRLGEDEAIRLAERIRSREPVDSPILISLPEDLSPVPKLDLASAAGLLKPHWDRMEAIKTWSRMYIQEETGLPVIDMLTNIAIPRPEIPGDEPDDFPYTLCALLAFAKATAPDADKLDITACKGYDGFKEDIERVRAILPDDEGGWYQAYMEHSYVRELSLLWSYDLAVLAGSYTGECSQKGHYWTVGQRLCLKRLAISLYRVSPRISYTVWPSASGRMMWITRLRMYTVALAIRTTPHTLALHTHIPCRDTRTRTVS